MQREILYIYNDFPSLFPFFYTEIRTIFRLIIHRYTHKEIGKLVRISLFVFFNHSIFNDKFFTFFYVVPDCFRGYIHIFC